jgi:type III restriction enzyme
MQEPTITCPKCKNEIKLNESLAAPLIEATHREYLVRALVDFDDVSYDNHADLLYDLAGQMVAHLKSYLKDAGEVANVLQYYPGSLRDSSMRRCRSTIGRKWRATMLL